MTISDTDCIKYIENEMDPSEKIVFEREMESNSDLLIEVESIRCVKKKLDDLLPLVSAPESVLDSVQTFAGQNQRSEKAFGFLYFSAAALLLCTITAGIVWMDEPASDQNNINNAAVNAEFVLPGNNAASDKASSDVTPWIDRNQILHFTGDAGEFHGDARAEFENSFQNLRPVLNQQNINRAQHNLHLTRTSN